MKSTLSEMDAPLSDDIKSVKRWSDVKLGIGVNKKTSGERNIEYLTPILPLSQENTEASSDARNRAV